MKHCSVRSLWREEGTRACLGLSGGGPGYWLACCPSAGSLLIPQTGSDDFGFNGLCVYDTCELGCYGKMLTAVWDGEVLRCSLHFFKVSPPSQCSRRASLRGDPLVGLLAWSSRPSRKCSPRGLQAPDDVPCKTGMGWGPPNGDLCPGSRPGRTCAGGLNEGTQSGQLPARVVPPPPPGPEQRDPTPRP